VSLSFQLQPAGAVGAAGDVLGGAYIGPSRRTVATAWPEQHIAAPLLGASAAAMEEIWRRSGDGQDGLTEGIAWRRRGEALFGVIELDEAAFPATPARSPLQAASEEAYARIFRLLAEQGLPHLWRVWNYLADINGASDGLERYRQFNIGRQDAFVAASRGVSGDVPAACALGLAAGPLSIAFLAGGCPALPIENPRQVSAYDYPADYGPRSPTFSRGALVFLEDDAVLFISGTASIVGHQTLHAGDVARQCRESVANIAAVMAEANRVAAPAAFTLGDLAYRVYVRHADDHGLVRDTLMPLIDGAADVVFLQADICRADLLLEIEAVAARPLEHTE